MRLTGNTALLAVAAMLLMVLFFSFPYKPSEVDVDNANAGAAQSHVGHDAAAHRDDIAGERGNGLPRVPNDLGITWEKVLAKAEAMPTQGQQTTRNYVHLAETIWEHAPGNLLVFGLGRDTQLHYQVRAAAAPKVGRDSAAKRSWSVQPGVRVSRPTRVASVSLWSSRRSGSTSSMPPAS